MILWRFGPKRLSPSLVVWQVRHALLNVSCPDSVSAPLPADSWGTAGKPRSTRNVVQTNPEIAVRGISEAGEQTCGREESYQPLGRVVLLQWLQMRRDDF